ncbi:RidA family protein [Cellulomonas sp. ACRRI]|uniref:RidA family protein n=1 Tax=Cellulomonas sp. ACRRI TaxID=2918188 RepID=UPI001EF2A824|nr:RidA family protein [Cellulomonas sp. ACRRI]MCG7285773.1 RidA family protein [Cellulomonas sp. ACRRI]
MDAITRHEIHEGWAHAGMVEAGGLVFVSYCVGRTTGTTAEQVHGALDTLEARLATIGLSLAEVVQVDALFADIWEIPAMEAVFRERFTAGYPARKSIQTAFAHEGLRFQLDAVAHRGAATP